MQAFLGRRVAGSCSLLVRKQCNSGSMPRQPNRLETRCASASTSAPSTSSEPAKPVEMCVIVDEHNRVVGAQPRDVTVRNRLLGRGAYVLVFSPPAQEGGAQGQQQGQRQGQQLLVYKRSSRKDVYPGHWDVVTAGVVRAGEEYEDTAARELAEELGVSEAAAREGLTRLFVFPYQDNICHVWGAAFTYTLPAGQVLALQEEEVDWAGFKSMAEVSELLTTERFTPVGKHILDLYLQQQQP